MAAFRDLTGKRFGRLTVLRRGPNDNHGKAMWVCRCDCEKEVKVNGASLVRSLTQSCGCLHRERTSEACLTLEPVSGERFGRLTFIEEVPREVSNNRVFRCFRLRCDCGNET